MAVPATYGVGNFGLTTEASCLVSEVSSEITTEQSWAKNHVGQDAGVTIFNEAATMTFNYFTTTVATPPFALGGFVAAAGMGNEAFVHTPVTGTEPMMVVGHSFTGSATDYHTGTTTLLYREGITPA